MAKQPLLPGFTFEKTQGKNFHLKHNFNVVNGYSIPNLNLNKFPKTPFEPFFTLNQDYQPYNVKESIQYCPLEIYTKYKKPIGKVFTPPYVINDGKCLSFQGYFKHEIPEWGSTGVLYRKINLIYYLEDDTMTIIEPPIANSGYPQGRLVRRGKIPRLNSSEIWHWKNLNVGIDVEVYGIVYHLNSCDRFTKDYLSSQGIEVNENEEIPKTTLPAGSYLNNRRYLSFCYGAHEETLPSQDKLYKFLQYDRKVLRFYGFWSEEENIDSCRADIKYYKIYYYLIDDTVEIRESPARFSQNEPFKRLLKRTKLPKNYKRGPVQDSGISSSKSADQEYYQPQDIRIGEYIHILGRKFFIYDCDDFTRVYYKECLKSEQPARVSIPEKHPQPVIKEIPPHTGIGQPEDTLQSCLFITPKPPKKDVIHYVENSNKYLRYSAKLDSNIEDDKERQFIIQFSLADGKISIYEVRVPNSGFTPGYFLKSALVPKVPYSTCNHQPEYYKPADFIIGTCLVIFGRKFIITGADLAVLRYMESQPQKFGATAIDSVRAYLKRKKLVDDDIGGICPNTDNVEADLEKLHVK